MKEKELIDWVESFMKRNGLFASSGVVGLSGGADSLLLSHVLEALRGRGLFKNLRHLHIDHGLRKNSGDQAFALRDYAKSRGWEFELVKVTGPVPDSNIEAWARDQRKSIFKSNLEAGEVLYLGHHIDDSFEWFLRQTVGSSSSGHSHGIPLINGAIRRPFHCLTKKQIQNFSKTLKLPVQKDQSNESLSFQRNAISKLVKRPLLDLFPKGLAHYVEHANNWADREGFAVSTKVSEKLPQTPCKLLQNYIGKGVYSLIKISADQKLLNEWSPYKDDIVRLITTLSNKDRGELRLNLDKLINAARTNGARGPLSFSGGVRVFIYPGMLIFLDSSSHGTITRKNDVLSKAAQIPSDVLTMEMANKKIELQGGLGFIAFEADNLFGLKGLNYDELFGDTVSVFKSKGLSVRPFSQLYQRAAKSHLLNFEFNGRVLH